MVSVAAHENGVSGLNGTPSGSEAGLFHNRKTGMRAGMAIDIGKPKGALKWSRRQICKTSDG